MNREAPFHGMLWFFPEPGVMQFRSLTLETLESRRLMALLIDSVSNVVVDEGQTASVSAEFFDTSPGGNFTTSVRWMSDTVEQPGSIDQLPSGSNGPLRVRFDYRYDTSGFFDATRRELLDAAAEIVVGRLDDQLAGFTSAGNNQFTAQFLNPATGVSQSIPGFSVAANELIVFVGTRDLPDADLANAGAGGGSANQSFFNFATSRGQQGVPATDFAPWGGAISFDSEANWHSGLSTEGLAGNENDFLSVAVHEMGHILGFTVGVDSFNRYIAGGRFNGPASIQAHDGLDGPPLAPDNSHWEEGLRDGGQETSFDPSVVTGRRKLMTELDFAALDDIAWDLRGPRGKGEVGDTNIYADNGSFTGRIRINSATEQATRNFQITVRNVPPTIAEVPTLTGRAGLPIQLSAQFSDPGVLDTHTATIGWRDGSGQQELSVEPSSRTLSGTHVYAQPGTYQALIRIQDDDGGETTREVTIIVSAPPRGDWQNKANPFDVNANSLVDPLDALLVINELNNREFSDPNTGILPPAPNNLMTFVDVTGDDIVAPQDALLVINELPASSGGSLRSPVAATSITTLSRPSLSAEIPPLSVDLAELDQEPGLRADAAFADFSMIWLDA